MRKIDKIIIHCSATKEGKDFRLNDIAAWHKDRHFPLSGGTYCGYHYVIDLDGRIEIGKDLKYTGCHCEGHNAHSIGICYIGGLDSNGNPADTRTRDQRFSLMWLVMFLKAVFPEAKICGHRDLANRDCPCFEVRDLFTTDWCLELKK